MSITRFNIDQVLAELLSVMETELPAELAADASLPVLSSFRIGEPTAVNDDEWPTLSIVGIQGGRDFAAGRIVEPTTEIDLIVAFAYTGNNDGYLHGLKMASLALKVVLANDDNPPYWEKVMMNSMRVSPVWEIDRYQGGVATVHLVGPDIVWT